MRISILFCTYFALLSFQIPTIIAAIIRPQIIRAKSSSFNLPSPIIHISNCHQLNIDYLTSAMMKQSQLKGGNGAVGSESATGLQNPKNTASTRKGPADMKSNKDDYSMNYLAPFIDFIIQDVKRQIYGNRAHAKSNITGAQSSNNGLNTGMKKSKNQNDSPTNTHKSVPISNNGVTHVRPDTYPQYYLTATGNGDTKANDNRGPAADQSSSDSSQHGHNARGRKRRNKPVRKRKNTPIRKKEGKTKSDGSAATKSDGSAATKSDGNAATKSDGNAATSGTSSLRKEKTRPNSAPELRAGSNHSGTSNQKSSTKGRRNSSNKKSNHSNSNASSSGAQSKLSLKSSSSRSKRQRSSYQPKIPDMPAKNAAMGMVVAAVYSNIIWPPHMDDDDDEQPRSVYLENPHYKYISILLIGCILISFLGITLYFDFKSYI